MDPSRYRFHTTWHLHAPRAAVYDALVDVPSYPRWWPEVRAVRDLGGDTGELRCRSLLPYDLVFVLTREVEDADRGILRARLSGDLNGTCEWRIGSAGQRTIAEFDEDVAVGKRAVRAAGVLARPALRYNHDRMMRSGARGLARHLDA